MQTLEIHPNIKNGRGLTIRAGCPISEGLGSRGRRSRSVWVPVHVRVAVDSGYSRTRARIAIGLLRCSVAITCLRLRRWVLQS